MFLKNKTNHTISNNIHPSASASKVIHSFKIGEGGTKPTEKSYNFDKV